MWRGAWKVPPVDFKVSHRRQSRRKRQKKAATVEHGVLITMHRTEPMLTFSLYSHARPTQPASAPETGQQPASR